MSSKNVSIWTKKSGKEGDLVLPLKYGWRIFFGTVCQQYKNNIKFTSN
jgi:hypothetical protein